MFYAYIESACYSSLTYSPSAPAQALRTDYKINTSNKHGAFAMDGTKGRVGYTERQLHRSAI